MTPTWTITDSDRKQRSVTVQAADTIQTFTDGDATPSIANYAVFKTANTSDTTITDFDGGIDGQEITVIVDDEYTIFGFGESGTSVKGHYNENWRAKTGDMIRCVYDATDDVWRCYPMPIHVQE